MEGSYRFNYPPERTQITTYTYDENGRLLGVLGPSGEALTMEEYNKYRAEQMRLRDAKTDVFGIERSEGEKEE